jgi:hypothetical protein
MSRGNKSSLSGSSSYEQLSDYWDTHSLADHWEQTHPVEFELDVKSSRVVTLSEAAGVSEES